MKASTIIFGLIAISLLVFAGCREKAQANAPLGETPQVQETPQAPVEPQAQESPAPDVVTSDEVDIGELI